MCAALLCNKIVACGIRVQINRFSSGYFSLASDALLKFVLCSWRDERLCGSNRYRLADAVDIASAATNQRTSASPFEVALRGVGTWCPQLDCRGIRGAYPGAM